MALCKGYSSHFAYVCVLVSLSVSVTMLTTTYLVYTLKVRLSVLFSTYVLCAFRWKCFVQKSSGNICWSPQHPSLLDQLLMDKKTPVMASFQEDYCARLAIVHITRLSHHWSQQTINVTSCLLTFFVCIKTAHQAYMHTCMVIQLGYYICDRVQSLIIIYFCGCSRFAQHHHTAT